MSPRRRPGSITEGMPGTEVTGSRTERTIVKDTTHDLSTGTSNRRVRISVAPISHKHHTNKGGAWRDNDPHWAFVDGSWRARGVPFDAVVTGLAQYRYVEDDVRFIGRLERIDTILVAGQPVGSPFLTMDDRALRWVDVVEGIDVTLVVHMGGVTMHKNIKNAFAPRNFMSTGQFNADGPVTLEALRPRDIRAGWDNARRTVPYKGNDPDNPLARFSGDYERELVMAEAMEETSRNLRTVKFQAISAWNGFTKARDEANFFYETDQDVAYPVTVIV